ncbi:high mobility group box domain-containing protein [Parasitella parasitica]|nr:high mobility group box domain-containing protein [Parasitella parasitica]
MVIANITENLTELAEILLSTNTAAPVDENKRKRPKDPNAPKQPLSKFLLFSNSIRDDVDKEYPDATFTEKSKIFGAKWRELTDEQKKPFTEQADKEKEIYLRKKAAYDKAHPDFAQFSEKRAKKEVPNKEKPSPKKANTAHIADAVSSSSASSSDSSSDSDSESDRDSSSDDSD